MKYDLIIIGAGPGGYVSAIRAGQLGLKTLIADKKYAGGMCLNWGCIPTKALFESGKLYYKLKNEGDKFGVGGLDFENLFFDWKKSVKRASKIVRKLTKGVEFLFKKNNVEFIIGEASIRDEHSISVNGRNIEFDNLIISTGSKPEKLQSVNSEITEIENLLNIDNLKDTIAVIGRGPHTAELAQFFSLIGKNAVIFTDSENLLLHTDTYLNKYLLDKFSKSKIKIVISNQIQIEDNIIKTENDEFKADLIINGSLRKGILPESNIEFEIEDSFIRTDSEFKTNYDNIFAVGDVNGKSIFAHAASAQGLYVVNKLNGVKDSYDSKKIPINIYSYPEISQIGYTEEELKDKEVDFKISEFPLSANGKALAEGETEGFIRILSENRYGEVMGVQIVSSNASDMIAEAASIMQIEGTVYDIAQTVHAHPTVSEIFMEAGFEAVDKAIHK